MPLSDVDLPLSKSMNGSRHWLSLGNKDNVDKSILDSSKELHSSISVWYSIEIMEFYRCSCFNSLSSKIYSLL